MRLEIGGGTHLIIVSEKYRYAYDYENNLLLYPKVADDLIIRFSVISFDRTDGEKNAAVAIVKAKAEKNGQKFHSIDSETIFAEHSEQRKPDSDEITKSWAAGCKNFIIVISFSYFEYTDDTLVDQVSTDVQKMIESIVEKK